MLAEAYNDCSGQLSGAPTTDARSSDARSSDARFWVSLAAGPLLAADLVWEVENPFRFFKPTRSFALHEAAFNAVRGEPSAPLPSDIIWRTERRA